MRRDMKRELIDQFKGNLTRYMELRGLNPRSLSLAAGLGATAVRDIIEGKSSEPRYSTIRCLSGALRCQMTDLVPDDPTWPSLPDQKQETNEPALTESVIGLAVVACDEAEAALKRKFSPSSRAEYVIRLCRWIASQANDSGELPSVDELRKLITFHIESNNSN